jgi:hypothetical protein
MKITLNKATVYQVGKVRLLPGDNEVSGKDIHAMLQNKIVQKDIAAGILTVEHESPAPVAKPKPVEEFALEPSPATDEQAEVVEEAPAPAPVKRRGRKKQGE